MKKRLIAFGVLLVVAGAAGTLVYRHERSSPVAKQARLVEQFIAILPDSLSNDHIVEIRQLFYTLRQRAELGKVRRETMEEITGKLETHIARGHITASNLVYFMAEVGNAIYKDEPHYNPADHSGDHPVLNPEAGKVSLGFDSTQFDSAFWADYRKYEKAHREEFSDSASGPVR